MRGALLSLGLALLVLCAARPAGAVELQPGQEVALALDAAMAAGSAASIVGNAVTLAQRKPSRSWIITGYFFGTLNMVISPLLLVYGREPDAAFGLGMGAMHGVLGAANFALSIYGSVLWHRAGRAREAPQLSLVPITGRDSAGQLFSGVGLRLARF